MNNREEFLQPDGTKTIRLYYYGYVGEWHVADQNKILATAFPELYSSKSEAEEILSLRGFVKSVDEYGITKYKAAPPGYPQDELILEIQKFKHFYRE